MGTTIQLLEINTPVEKFSCGNADLDDFLKTDALSNMDDWVSVTKVIFVDKVLAGYFTITPDTIHKGRVEYSDKVAEYPYQKYPAVKLARLAVDEQFQHRGIGTELMADFFKTARKVVKSAGGRYVTVDAKNTACAFYERFGFRKVLSQKDSDIVSMYLDFKKFYQLSKSLLDGTEK